jgi:stress-induced-phosphoprotein 1
LFADGNYPGAIKEYDEGMRRDPKSSKVLANRCAAYIKLMEFPSALKDAEHALTLDPTFVKVYARKANIHHMMKEYHKALSTYD